MEWVGLLFEFLFLGIGVYFYLFAIGKVNSNDPAAQKRITDLRNRNGWWIRLAALAITAIMLVNIVLHVRQLLK